LTESNATKSSANALFARAAFSDAISTYDRALSSCPNYLEYEVAVLRNNIAACHIKLQEWKAAVEAASKALDCLQRLDPVVRQEKGKEDSVVEEVDDATADRIERLGESGHTRDEVQKMRVKALLRRGRGNLEIGGWAALQAAEDGQLFPRVRSKSSADYRIQITSSYLPCLSCQNRIVRLCNES